MCWSNRRSRAKLGASLRENFAAVNLVLSSEQVATLDGIAGTKRKP
jgi:hypothetical protein